MLHIYEIIVVVRYSFCFEYHIFYWIGHQKSEQNDVNKSSHNQGARENNDTNNHRGKRRREPPFDNKYGVDLRLCKY